MNCAPGAFGRVDTVVSAGKKRIDQFPTIVKENSVQIPAVSRNSF